MEVFSAGAPSYGVVAGSSWVGENEQTSVSPMPVMLPHWLLLVVPWSKCPNRIKAQNTDVLLSIIIA